MDAITVGERERDACLRAVTRSSAWCRWSSRVDGLVVAFLATHERAWRRETHGSSSGPVRSMSGTGERGVFSASDRDLAGPEMRLPTVAGRSGKARPSGTIRPDSDALVVGTIGAHLGRPSCGWHARDVELLAAALAESIIGRPRRGAGRTGIAVRAGWRMHHQFGPRRASESSRWRAGADDGVPTDTPQSPQ